jgi:hypothetical protein
LDSSVAGRVSGSPRTLEEPREPHRVQQTKLDWIATTDPRLYRGYLFKEGLRTGFVIGHRGGPDAGIEALDRWLSSTARSRITPFVTLAARSADTDPKSKPPSAKTCPTPSLSQRTSNDQNLWMGLGEVT